MRDAREQLGAGDFDALVAEIVALDYDEVVHEIHMRFARELDGG